MDSSQLFQKLNVTITKNYYQPEELILALIFSFFFFFFFFPGRSVAMQAWRTHFSDFSYSFFGLSQGQTGQAWHQDPLTNHIFIINYLKGPKDPRITNTFLTSKVFNRFRDYLQLSVRVWTSLPIYWVNSLLSKPPLGSLTSTDGKLSCNSILILKYLHKIHLDISQSILCKLSTLTSKLTLNVLNKCKCVK